MHKTPMAATNSTITFEAMLHIKYQSFEQTIAIILWNGYPAGSMKSYVSNTYFCSLSRWQADYTAARR